jgi:hypothetical protein
MSCYDYIILPLIYQCCFLGACAFCKYSVKYVVHVHESGFSLVLVSSLAYLHYARDCKWLIGKCLTSVAC